MLRPASTYCIWPKLLQERVNNRQARVNGRTMAAKRAGRYFIAESVWAARKTKVARSEGCCKRVRNAERARIAAWESEDRWGCNDAQASETCKRLCMLPEGLARRRRKLSLRRWFISARRGVSESPWITGRSEWILKTSYAAASVRTSPSGANLGLLLVSAARFSH